jgi:hypothetical protein
LKPADLRILDRDMRRPDELGTFCMLVGGSSKGIRLGGEIAVR